MKDKGQITKNWKQDLWKSLDEQDVMQLRKQLNDIQIQTDNQIQSYCVNYTEDSANFMLNR